MGQQQCYNMEAHSFLVSFFWNAPHDCRPVCGAFHIMKEGI